MLENQLSRENDLVGIGDGLVVTIDLRIVQSHVTAFRRQCQSRTLRQSSLGQSRQ